MAVSEVESRLTQEPRLGLFAGIPPEEIVNSITHAAGLALSIAGATALVILAGRRGDAWHVAGCTVYAVSLIAVYAASTLSHMLQAPALKRFFAVLDRGVIYLLIAGTYTPFALVYFRTGWWWVLSGMMWGVALLGFFSKVLFEHRAASSSVATYVLLGWLPLLAIKPMLTLVPLDSLWWMLGGGLCYTIGTVFLVLDQKVPYFHAVWHLLVIAGSACHFAGILLYVLPY